MTKVRYWSIERFSLMVCKMLLNKFDCFIIIEGNRGLGKSTFAYKLSKKINFYFRHIERETGKKNSEFCDWYRFNPYLQVKDPFKFRYVIYSQQDVINFYDGWHKSAIADEMINVAFNREFFSTEQKNLVKMINMNRDHGNLLIACVPQFQNIDNQIKNLCKIRITVCRRGLAVIQTPNRTIYNRDKWDSANNEKIERDWLKKGSGLPQYSRLNTFRGMIKFKALSPREQKIYDLIKLKERNVIKTDLGIITYEKIKNPVDDVLERLLNGGIRNTHQFQGIAMGLGKTSICLGEIIRKKLVKLKKNPTIKSYFYEKKDKNQGKIEKTPELFS